MNTTDKQASVNKLIHDLKKERDEIKLQLHLGSMELKEEWQTLNDKLNALSHEYDPLKDAVEETAEDVWDSMKLVGSELWGGFKRIRQAL
ncbi:hypothetical protein [Planctomycetes bacterium K23_9]|uniref:Coiled coil domain-containing protein n=1 Tax=Stieleria marina TaxID=1930275 RepID=A0A517P007_9BACT|nr:hypothetical protein K239x_47160 [Planctomycetes bacterium K23_9]